MEEKKPKPKRVCGSCTRCCEGWLFGEAYGHVFYKGAPCFFVDFQNKNCSIYKDRPENPCKKFICAWLDSDEFPMWFKPDLSNIIIRKIKTGSTPVGPVGPTSREVEYYDIIETGVKMDSSVLNWLFLWALKNRKNIKYTVDGGPNYYGSKEFVEMFQIK